MNDNDFSIGFVAGLIFAALFTMFVLNGMWEEDAIERGYALYCPKSGGFAWEGECD